MATRKTKKKHNQQRRPKKSAKARKAGTVKLVGVPLPEPVTEVVTEERYITTEPEIEIRKPATLAQALTEPEVAVVKPRTTVKRVRAKTRRAA